MQSQAGTVIGGGRVSSPAKPPAPLRRRVFEGWSASGGIPGARAWGPLSGGLSGVGRRVEEAGGRPGNVGLEARRVGPVDDPIGFAAPEVEVNPAQAERIRLRPGPVDPPEQVACGLAGAQARLEGEQAILEEPGI